MKARQIRIRPAVPNDLDSLVELEKACFAIPWSKKSLLDDLTKNPNARVLVAELPDGSLAGYLSGWVVLDEMQINNIAVVPKARRQGIGRRLLDSLIRVAEDADLASLTLEVRASGQAARALYESCGFAPVGIRRAYYADTGENAIIMLKKLGQY